MIEIEAEAVRSLLHGLDEGFDRAVEAMKSTSGRVIVTGIGKSGIVGQKIAATLASTGTASFFLHPAEAIHGDLGMILPGDVVVALSHSGESEEVVNLVPHVRRRGATLVALTGRPGSTLGQERRRGGGISIREEACPLNLAPTASTTAQLVMGDALAMALSVEKGFRPEDFAALHPGGKLGKRFLRVQDLMHGGDAVPIVLLDTPMREVIYEMSKKRFGVTGVIDADGRLAGVISDGDLRRLLERDALEIARDRAADAMTASPEDDRRRSARHGGAPTDGGEEDHVALRPRRRGPADRHPPPARPLGRRVDLTMRPARGG